MFNRINTVQELIDRLNEIEDKTKPVFVYDNKSNDLINISLVDTDISDRVDINLDRPLNNIVSGARVQKMVFLEREEIGAETIDFLENNGFLQEVDYGNVELSSDDFKQIVENFDDYDKEMSNGEEITLEQIKEEIGLDVAQKLITGEIDFIQVIY